MRHGETEWSRDHKHTSRTDLALLPGGEAAARGLGELAGEVAGRADRVIDRVRASGTERALLFAHGHLLRVLAARWLEQAPEEGARYRLDTATISVLGWERETRVILRWNS